MGVGVGVVAGDALYRALREQPARAVAVASPSPTHDTPGSVALVPRGRRGRDALEPRPPTRRVLPRDGGVMGRGDTEGYMMI